MEVTGGGAPLQALKKAEDVQEQTVTRLLDDSAKQQQEVQAKVEETQKVSGAALTGLGTGLDIRG